MNFNEANPSDEQYWWVIDGDTPEIAFIEIHNDKKATALFLGSPVSYDARELEFLGPVALYDSNSGNNPFSSEKMLNVFRGEAKADDVQAEVEQPQK